MKQAKLKNSQWDFWIDRGGTFTDVVGRRPDGTLHRPQAPVGKSRRPIATPPCRASATCSALQARRADPAPAAIGAVKMGTTVATNALLERKGDRTLLLTTKGFRDALRDRLPGAAEDLRQAHHQAGDAVTSAWSRSTSACAPTARSSARSISPRCARELERALRRRHRGGRHRVHARLPLSRARAARRRARARDGLSRRSRSATRSRR